MVRCHRRYIDRAWSSKVVVVVMMGEEGGGGRGGGSSHKGWSVLTPLETIA